MIWACFACALGWPMAFVVGLVASSGLGDSWPAWSKLTLMLMFAVGVGSCSVEDRVCEMAERQDVQP
jgi:hypothetical protein